MSLIYVTGHRNPDTDSIAAAIGYSELKRRLDRDNEYKPVRLGEPNAQTRWVLDRSGAPTPDFLPHVMLRVCDVMRTSFATARYDEPVREVGLEMAKAGLDLMPVLDDEGALAGVITERALARRYVRESREVSSLDAPTAIRKIVAVLDGELLAGEDGEVAGRVWTYAMDTRTHESRIVPGDVVVVGNRPDAQRLVIELGAALLVASNGVAPEDDVIELARERGTAIAVSPLDTYVSSRMITLAAPCRALMDADPLTVSPRTSSATTPTRSRTSITARPSRSMRAGARSGSSPVPTSSSRARAGCCSWITPSRRRACPGSRRRRSRRSSTTTTSARWRRGCRSLRRSTPSGRRRRS